MCLDLSRFYPALKILPWAPGVRFEHKLFAYCSGGACTAAAFRIGQHAMVLAVGQQGLWRSFDL